MRSVLIIEDDPYILRFYQRLFSHADYHIELIANGAEGIAKSKALLPSLILLDLMMPGMNGIEVLTHLKADPITADIPVVMLTNYGEEEMVKKSVVLGATAFIIKSNVPPEKLLLVVEQYVQSMDNGKGKS